MVSNISLKKKFFFKRGHCESLKILADAMVVIILLDIKISQQHIVPLNLTHF